MADESKEIKKIPLMVGIAIAASVMLSKVGFGPLLFCLPLLIITKHIKKTFHAVLCFVASEIGVAALYLFECRHAFSNPNMLGVVLMGLLFPLMGSVGCAVWTGLRNYSNSVLRKLVICSFFTGIIALVFVIWICGPWAENQSAAILAAYKAILPSQLFGDKSETIIQMVLSAIILMMVPFGMIFSGFQILVSELVLHKEDEEWQYNFAYMKMPNYYVWFFIAFWVVALLGNVLKFVPRMVSIVAWNLALGISLHYLVGGLSVLTSLLRRHSATLTASKVFIPVVMLSFLPGVNVAVLTALVVLGVLETWVKMR